MDFFFSPQSIFSSYRERLTLPILLLLPFTFLFTMAQAYALDKETCSTCCRSILFSVSAYAFAPLLPLTG